MTLDQRNAVIESSMPYVERMARKRRYNVRGWDVEDWISEAYVALVLAVDKWTPERGIDMVPWIMTSVYYGLQHAFRDAVRPSCSTGDYLDEVTPDWADTIAVHHDVHRDPDLQKAVEKLPDMQRAIVYAHYVEGWSDPEIGRAIGRPASTVRHYRDAGLDQLRRSYSVF